MHHARVLGFEVSVGFLPPDCFYPAFFSTFLGAGQPQHPRVSEWQLIELGGCLLGVAGTHHHTPAVRCGRRGAQGAGIRRQVPAGPGTGTGGRSPGRRSPDPNTSKLTHGFCNFCLLDGELSMLVRVFGVWYV